MSAPMNLNISSEIIAAQSALNMYPECPEHAENNQENYISEIYPEATQAMEYLYSAFKGSVMGKLVHVDLEALQKACSNKNVQELKDSLSITDDLEYRKNLILAKESLEKIKHLEYMIEHSIDHIESALSFSTIKFSTYYFKVIEEHQDIPFENLAELVHTFIILESTLK